MGNVSSVGPDGNRLILTRLNQLTRKSHFDAEEIEVLFEKFNSLRVHTSQKVDFNILSASPISCRSFLIAPEFAANVFLQSMLCKFFSSPFRDFLLGTDNRVQISTVTVTLPPGPLGLQVRPGMRGVGLYISDASESLVYKQVRAGMHLIGIDSLNVGTLDYERIVKILVEGEDRERVLHFQLIGHDVEEEHAQREIHRVRSRIDPPKQIEGRKDGDPNNPYDSDSDWEESTTITHATLSAGPMHAVLTPGLNGFCAQVKRLQPLEFGAQSELQRAGVVGGMMLVGINNIHANRLRFPEIISLLQESSRQSERLLRFRDSQYFRQRELMKKSRRKNEPHAAHPLYRAPTDAEFDEEVTALKRARAKSEESAKRRAAAYAERRKASLQSLLAKVPGPDQTLQSVDQDDGTEDSSDNDDADDEDEATEIEDLDDLEIIDLEQPIKRVDVQAGSLGLRLVGRDKSLEDPTNTNAAMGAIINEFVGLTSKETGLKEKSPVEIAGVPEGAELVAINDQSVSSMRFGDIMSTLRSLAKREKSLHFRCPAASKSASKSSTRTSKKKKKSPKKKSNRFSSRPSKQLRMTQDVQVPAGPLGMRLAAANKSDSSAGESPTHGVVVQEFVGIKNAATGLQDPSPVELAGIEVGMQLICIDDESVEGKAYTEVMAMLRKRARQPKTLRFSSIVVRDVEELTAQAPVEASPDGASSSLRRSSSQVQILAKKGMEEENSLIITVPGGPLGLRLMPRNHDTLTGAVILEFTGVTDAHTGKTRQSVVESAGVNEGMELFAINGEVVTALDFNDIMYIVNASKDLAKTLRFRHAIGVSTSLSPPTAEGDVRDPGLNGESKLAVGERPESPNLTNNLENTRLMKFPTIRRGASFYAESRSSLGGGAGIVARQEAAHEALLLRQREREKLETEWSVWMAGTMEDITVHGTTLLGEVTRKKNVRMVLSKNVLVFYVMEKPKKRINLLGKTHSVSSGDDAADITTELQQLKQKKKTRKKKGKQDEKVLRRLGALIEIDRHCTVGGHPKSNFFTLCAQTVAKPDQVKSGFLKQLACRQPFEDAKLPVQTKYELVDGTQGIIHEGGDDTKEFEVEFEPKSKRQSMHWVDMIESVIQRQSKVLTSSFVFNFEPKALPQAAAPPSGWPELVSHSLIGVDFRSDDHGRGAILAAYSPSRQLEFFGIPLQSALLRVNSLEVAHLTHSRAMEMIDIAVRRARPRRHESSRTITLEFCSPDDYYQYFSRDIFVEITASELLREVELGPDEHGNAAAIVAFHDNPQSSSPISTATASVDELSASQLVQAMNRSVGSGLLRRAGVTVGMVIIALGVDSLLDVSYDEAVLFLSRGSYTTITLRHHLAHHSPGTREVGELSGASAARAITKLVRRLPNSSVTTSGGTNDVPSRRLSLAERRRESALQRHSSMQAMQTEKPSLDFITVSEFTEGDIFHSVQLVARDPPTHIFEDSLHHAHPSFRHFSTRQTQRTQLTANPRAQVSGGAAPGKLASIAAPPKPPKSFTAYKGCIVHRINDPQSTFARKGIQPGMELIEVNGRDVRDLPFDDVAAQIFSAHYFTSNDGVINSVLRLRFRSVTYPSPAVHEEDQRAFVKPAQLQMAKLVEFEEFVGLCSIFSPMASAQEKAAWVARVVDEDNDGYISYENAFALLKALHGTQLSDAQLDRATIAFLHSCGIEEENLFDKVSTMPRRLTDREFSIWHIRQASRSQRPTQLRSGRAGNNVETRSRMRVPRYVFERMLVDNVAVQRMMTMEFHLERARY